MEMWLRLIIGIALAAAAVLIATTIGLPPSAARRKERRPESQPAADPSRAARVLCPRTDQLAAVRIAPRHDAFGSGLAVVECEYFAWGPPGCEQECLTV